MTYTVSSGTLYPTISYHRHFTGEEIYLDILVPCFHAALKTPCNQDTGDAIVSWLCRVFNAAWKQGTIPKE